MVSSIARTVYWSLFYRRGHNLDAKFQDPLLVENHCCPDQSCSWWWWSHWSLVTHTATGELGIVLFILGTVCSWLAVLHGSLPGYVNAFIRIISTGKFQLACLRWRWVQYILALENLSSFVPFFLFLSTRTTLIARVLFHVGPIQWHLPVCTEWWILDLANGWCWSWAFMAIALLIKRTKHSMSIKLVKGPRIFLLLLYSG